MKVITMLVSIVCFFQSIHAGYVQKYEGPLQVEFSEYFRVIKGLLPDNPIIIEAGAHYGDDTIKFSEMWPKGTVLSFEPNPGAFQKLEIATKNCHNVQIFPVALGEYNGEAPFYVCYGSTGDNPIYEGASSLLPPAEHMAIHYQGPRIKVPCRTLDSWCEENEISHVDFIWFDLEGMELQVLRASPRILSTLKAILVETSFQEFRKGMTQYSQIKEFLENHGFTLLCHYYAEGWQGDAIFVRKEN